MKTLEEQVGGDHYKKYKIQPLQFHLENNIGYVEGNIIDYVIRHEDKGGKEDLFKAIHLLKVLLEYRYGVSIDDMAVPTQPVDTEAEWEEWEQAPPTNEPEADGPTDFYSEAKRIMEDDSRDGVSPFLRKFLNPTKNVEGD